MMVMSGQQSVSCLLGKHLTDAHSTETPLCCNESGFEALNQQTSQYHTGILRLHTNLYNTVGVAVQEPH